MKTEKILEYELILLLIKYGEKPVSTALAKILGTSSNQLKDRLKGLELKKSRSADTKRYKRPGYNIEKIITQHPDKSEYLRCLFGRFENKLLFPEFKDVKEFFERHAANLGAIKSRSQVLPRLFNLLASLSPGELADLCKQKSRQEYSSLGIISDEIMKHD